MKILIVDDNATNLKLLRAMLEAESFPVVEAADGIEALAVLAQEKIDAIISDILMPRMDGYRFCYEVRKSGRFGRLPFIFYTSTYNSPSDAKLALDLGGNRFIEKPASAEVILAALRELSTETRPPTPTVTLPEVELMKEYNVRLVAKLEEKNSGLAAQAEALRESERKYRHLFESLSDAAFLAEADTGRIVETNDQAEL